MLLVEDDEAISSEVVEYLKRIFSKVYHATNGRAGYEMYEDFRPDIVITDIKMPIMNGLELARKIRNLNESVPIYIITAFTTEHSLMEGIEIGLTGWLKKPFLHTTLLDELDKIYTHFFKCDNIEICKGVVYNSLQHDILVDDKVLPLTRKENELLALLVKNANNIVTYDMIAYEIYRDKVMSDNALRVLVKTIRYKIPRLPLKNIFGVGYKLLIA